MLFGLLFAHPSAACNASDLMSVYSYDNVASCTSLSKIDLIFFVQRPISLFQKLHENLFTTFSVVRRTDKPMKMINLLMHRYVRANKV